LLVALVLSPAFGERDDVVADRGLRVSAIEEAQHTPGLSGEQQTTPALELAAADARDERAVDGAPRGGLVLGTRERCLALGMRAGARRGHRHQRAASRRARESVAGDDDSTMEIPWVGSWNNSERVIGETLSVYLNRRGNTPPVRLVARSRV
jgi:hypothetical protein